MTTTGRTRLVVVGGDAAGMTAASQVVRLRDDIDVVVFERGPDTSYSMCGIPYLVAGSIPHADDLVAKRPEEFRSMGMTVHMGTEVVGVDAVNRRVTARDVETGRQRSEPYDLLLLATGAHPVVPDLPGLAEYGSVVHTLDEGRRLRAELDAAPDLHEVVTVGSGYIGLEIAEALVERGVRARLIDRSPQVMKALDPEMAAVVEEQLTGFGIEVHLGEELREVHGDRGRCREVTTDRGTYRADTVVLGMGGRPNVALAEDAGCDLGESGAVAVDGRMRTSVPGVWAAGDVAEKTDLVVGGGVYVPLGTHANKEGKVAGLDLAAHPGDGAAVFPGVVGTAVTRLCAWDIARVGLTRREAVERGVAHEVVRFTGTAKAGYMPNPGTVHVQLLAARDGRVLGAQLVGTGNVAKQIDVAAMWCQLGVNVADAQFLDLSYAPPFGGTWSLLQVGARKLTRALGLSPQL